jgi:hypothetical protein
MFPPAGRSAEASEAAPTLPARQEYADGTRGALRRLFPAAPAAAVPLTWARRVLVAAGAAAAVVLAAVVLLFRIPGIPAWDTIYAEDYSEFLIGALQHPWHLFIQYNGYEQLLPRVVAQLVTYLPLAYAAKAFACCGALTAAGCALFIFHASAGHIRSVTLRVLLAVAVVLLPSAPMEIADSTVDAPWYLLLALFWAVLWRPRTRTGMVAAAVAGFVTAASTSIVIVFVPLLAARVFALRRVREHAVTAGWLAGCLVQLPIVVGAAASGQSRLVGGQDPASGRSDPLGDSLFFYLHDVVLRSVGWHLSWWLESRTTEDWATVIVAVALTVILGVLLAAQPGCRPFIAVALLTGFIVTVASVFLTPWPTVSPVTFHGETEARYTALPIFLIEAALIVGVDYALCRHRGPPARSRTGRRGAVTGLRPALAVTALVALLAVSWVADFRYKGFRSAPSAHQWSAVVAEWRHDCEISGTGNMRAHVTHGYWTIPCDRLRFLRPSCPTLLIYASGQPTLL